MLAAGCGKRAWCHCHRHPLIKAGQLTTCTGLPYEPFEFEQEGKVVGFDVDLVDLVAQELGVTRGSLTPRSTPPKRWWRSMLVVTHEMAFAREVADRVVFMDHGVVVEDGPSEQVISAPRAAHPDLPGQGVQPHSARPLS